ncbi:MAG: GNAT family N-acetyltransferase [Candidatus Eremiobacteraeota bacterium]|nr:GNAT family N-acetyltransferase [Candidatus Eremiobacteraeota bacterium]
MNERAIAAAPEIRRGTAEELETFGEFWLAMFEEVGNYSECDFLDDWRDRFRRYLQHRMNEGDAAFFVATDGARIVGTAGAIVSDGYPFVVHGVKRGYVFGVRVDPAFRGIGAATALTRASVAFLRTLGCERIRLHASRFGRPIYERLGFVPTNEMELLPSSG